MVRAPWPWMSRSNRRMVPVFGARAPLHRLKVVLLRGAVGADEGDDFSGVDRQVDGPRRDQTTEALFQPLGFQGSA